MLKVGTLTKYFQVRVSGGKKCQLFGKFDVLCFLGTPILRFALLPYSRRIKTIVKTFFRVHITQLAPAKKFVGRGVGNYMVPLPRYRGGLLVILIDCMIFLSPFLDDTRVSMSTVSFLAQLGSGILCQQNAFL